MSAGRQCARFGRFNLVGVLGAGLQIVLFDLLLKCFRIPEVAAAPIAVEIVVLHNFFWHERFTWRDRKLRGLRQMSIRLWRFHCGNGLISLVGNTALTYGLVEGLKSPALPAAVVAIAICAPVNFLIADRWVYGRTG
jgi:putative flippase GtrA